jgi:hypothetical protein
LFYGIRGYLGGLGTKLALVQIIRQSVSEKNSEIWELLTYYDSLKCLLPLRDENVFS